MSKGNKIKIEVKSSEYKISELEKNKTFFTNNIGADIVLIAYSVDLNKIAMGRNLKDKQLINLFAEFNNENLIKEKLIEIRLAGGDNSQQSKQDCYNLLHSLNQIDKETNVISIIGANVNDQFHPDSFSVDCYNGQLEY